MVFRFKCYNLPFSGGGMAMWTNTHCFDFFHVIFIVSICAKLQTSSASPSILINLFKVGTYLSCGKDYLSYQMCINTIQKHVIMNINNQDTFLQLYYARNIMLGK